MNGKIPEYRSITSEIVLKEWLNYNHPNRDGLDSLIEEEACITTEPTSAAEYSGAWVNPFIGFEYYPEKIYQRERYLSEVVPLLRGYLERRPVVDLGGGWHENMRKMLVALHASAYINIDRFLQFRAALMSGEYTPELPLDLYANTREQTGGPVRENNTQLITVKADMLDFVSRMPTGSANITVNGIDSMIIHSPRYTTAFAQELGRVALPGGIVFGVRSEVLYEIDLSIFRELKVPYFEDQERDWGFGDLGSMKPKIFERVK